MPANCSWQRLLDADGDDLEVAYRHILDKLGRQPGTLGAKDIKSGTGQHFTPRSEKRGGYTGGQPGAMVRPPAPIPSGTIRPAPAPAPAQTSKPSS